MDCEEQGNIDLDDLREKAAQHKDRLIAHMIHLPIDTRRV